MLLVFILVTDCTVGTRAPDRPTENTLLSLRYTENVSQYINGWIEQGEISAYKTCVQSNVTFIQILINY
jgi:hypothetical protein